jgi:hypothetical protein
MLQHIKSCYYKNNDPNDFGNNLNPVISFIQFFPFDKRLQQKTDGDIAENKHHPGHIF